MQFVPVLWVFPMLKQAGRKRTSAEAEDAATRVSAAVSTEEQITRLSQERLMLYRQGMGRPLSRQVRARLAELIRELDRLWEQRRYELAGPRLMQGAGPPKERTEPQAARLTPPARPVPT